MLPALAIAPATLSHHLKELENAGLITVRREGKYHLMSLRTEALDGLMDSPRARLRVEGVREAGRPIRNKKIHKHG